MKINWPELTLPPINLWSVWNMESPCKKKCYYSTKVGYCSSCGRTLDEISRWKEYTEDEKAYHNKLARLRLGKLNESSSV